MSENQFPFIVFTRDVLLTALCLFGWSSINEGYSIFLHSFLAVLSTLLAFFAHEWGHYLAGKLYGAHLKPNNKIYAFFLFKIIKLTSIRSFVALSLGGYF
ncbi:MAG: hypothetical protein ACPGEG_06440, partial [Salibacteraceae bacterium]